MQSFENYKTYGVSASIFTHSFHWYLFASSYVEPGPTLLLTMLKKNINQKRG